LFLKKVGKYIRIALSWNNLNEMEKVLITGASGLGGTRLTELLLKKGFEVNMLGRTKSIESNSFEWNIENGTIDKKAFEGVSAIIHLAGAGVADKRWNDKRKTEIIDSRINSAKLIFDFLKTNNHQVRTFISASAVGYYGDCGNKILTEEQKVGKGFLAKVCTQWEQSAKQFSKLGLREVRCRVGIILSDKGGALPELTRTIPLGIASYFAKNNLYYPWIHIDDVCGIIIHALENDQVSGAYNTTAQEPMLMKDLMKAILNTKKSKAVLVPAPLFAVKLAMGEMSEMLLSSQRCSADKIISTGFRFNFADIYSALQNIYQS